MSILSFKIRKCKGHHQGLPGVGVYPGHPGVNPAGVETPADGVGVGVTG